MVIPDPTVMGSYRRRGKHLCAPQDRSSRFGVTKQSVIGLVGTIDSNANRADSSAVGPVRNASSYNNVDLLTRVNAQVFAKREYLLSWLD